MGVVFYQISQFFTFIHKRSSNLMPYEFSTVWFFGFFEGFIAFEICSYYALKFQFIYLGEFSFTAILLFITGLNHYYFKTLKNGKRIVKNKPLLWNSGVASILLTVCFFCVCIFLVSKISWEVQDLIGDYRRHNINFTSIL
jgi:hypothetical protein